MGSGGSSFELAAAGFEATTLVETAISPNLLAALLRALRAVLGGGHRLQPSLHRCSREDEEWRGGASS